VGGCEKYHKKVPALKIHEVVALGKLTARRLAETNRTMCKAHPDRSAELFCVTHQDLICILCGTTRHEGCSGKQTIEDIADEKRKELKEKATQMREKGAETSKQVRFFFY
jgi:hypothetical protein